MDIIDNQGIPSETEPLALTNQRANNGLYHLKTFAACTPERVY